MKTIFRLTVAAAWAVAAAAQAQTAFRGDCAQANRFASSVTFKSAYRGVQRITTNADACGRDVVAVYNLSLRPGSSADYDMAGRYYYLWPTTGGACPEEIYNRLSGTARVTQKVQTVGQICEVSFILAFDITADETYGPNKFSKQITLIGSNTSRFAATLPTSTEAMVFYEAPVTLTNPAAVPDRGLLDRGMAPPPDPEDRGYAPWSRPGRGYGRRGY